jgi:hypothetical protein
VPRGGRRPGAGRKRGSLSKLTTQIAAREADKGVTPLEVMLQAMRAWHAEGKLSLAVAVAKDAAPYCHARLSSMQVDHGGSVGFALEIVEVLTHAPDAAAQTDGQASPRTAGLPAE